MKHDVNIPSLDLCFADGLFENPKCEGSEHFLSTPQVYLLAGFSPAPSDKGSSKMKVLVEYVDDTGSVRVILGRSALTDTMLL